MERFEKVAIPATAATVVVPPSTPPPGFAAKPIVTFPLNPDSSRPIASSTRTTTPGAIATPATTFVGCCWNTRRPAVLGPAVLSAATSALVSAPE